MLLSNLQFDLSYTAMELAKLLACKNNFCSPISFLFVCLLAPLVSKTETLEASALASFRSLARQTVSGETTLSMVYYLFNILNGLSICRHFSFINACFN